MKLHAEILTVRTRYPFIIARGGTDEYRVVTVRLVDQDGTEGWGEAAPSKYYGETAGTVMAALELIRPVVEGADPWSIERIERDVETSIGNNGSAKAAVSMALHDLAGKRLGVPLWKLWGLDPARAPKSSFTIGIERDMGVLRERVTEAAGYPILKVKLGSDRDREILRTIRDAAPSAVLRVDANAAWSAKHALSMIPVLQEYGVEFVEQPLPAHDLNGLRYVRERSSLPIVADESCIVASDIPPLAGVVDGINIKLAKCGSLREALRMIATARAHNMLVMCGCMIETSIGITAAAHFSPLLDYVDLDGAALLASDPFIGASIEGGVTRLPDAPGLGVARR
jgi:L-Ala-D/L-Glu epimerase